MFDYSALIEVMYQKRHTRKSLAPLLNLTPQGFGKYLKNGTPLPMNYVVTLAWALDIPSEDILTIFGKRVTSFAGAKKN